MAEEVRMLRIVVASPGDVQAERDHVEGVVAELNRGIARSAGVRLEVSRWEMDTYPGFHPEGPQGLIDPLLRISDSDLLIGIFWKRFGTPTHDAESGTEHEFLTAYKSWQAHGRPQLMVYFCQKAHTPQTTAETDQWGKVLAFRDQFPKEGLWWAYDDERDFERLLQRHLTTFIQQISEGGDASSVAGPEPRVGSGPAIYNTGSGAVATGGGAAAGKGGIVVQGDVNGNIILGRSTDKD